MRVLVHVKAFYDRVPVPPGTVVTDQDRKSGRVIPGRYPGEERMRVTRSEPSTTTISLSELEIVKWIIHKAMPQQGSQTVTRKEAVLEYIATRVMPEHAHPSHMTGFEVEDDGPDERLFRSFMTTGAVPTPKPSPGEAAAPAAATVGFHAALHEASGQPLISEDFGEQLVEAYLEARTSAQYVDALYQKFRVKKPDAGKAVA